MTTLYVLPEPDHYCIADDTWSFTRELVAAEIAKAYQRDTQYGSGIIEHLRSKIDWQEAVMRQALDALEDAKGYVEAELNDQKDLYKGYPNLAYKYASEQASLDLANNAIAALKEIPK